jgi:hypothetical protein
MELPDVYRYPTGGVTVISGMLSHLLYFKHGEHHLYSIRYLQSAIGLPICFTFVLSNFFNMDLIIAAKISTAVEAVYICSIWLSMLIYRVSPVHRLSHFPGPISWKLTKFTQCWKNRHFWGFKVLDDLHQTYGEYVRTGKRSHNMSNQMLINRSFRAFHCGSRCRSCHQRPKFSMYPICLVQHGRPIEINVRNA